MGARSAARVAVVGSANLDFVTNVESLPGPGETVLALAQSESAGGKGLNQAVSAARVVPVALIAAVGADDAGEVLRAAAVRHGVEDAEISVVPGPSGRAYVTVDAQAENSIVVVPGANSAISSSMVIESLGRVRPAVILMQSEIPAEVESAVGSWSERADVRLVWNASPVREVDVAVLALADPLVVNLGEAAAVAAQVTGSSEGGGIELAERLRRHCRSVVITLGAAGAVWATGEDRGRVPAVAVSRLVDTTGAGDEFAGALAAGIALSEPLEASVERAVAASARIIGQPRSHR